MWLPKEFPIKYETHILYDLHNTGLGFSSWAFLLVFVLGNSFYFFYKINSQTHPK